MAWDPDAPTEQASGHDGAFSYASETHAFAVGFGVGFASVMPVPRLKRFVFGVVGLGDETRSKAMREARKESWYALGGVAFGALAGLVSLVTVASVAL